MLQQHIDNAGVATQRCLMQSGLAFNVLAPTQPFGQKELHNAPASVETRPLECPLHLLFGRARC